MTAESVADELLKLAELNREGTLSDDEFAAAKARLIGASVGNQTQAPARQPEPPSAWYGLLTPGQTALLGLGVVGLSILALALLIPGWWVWSSDGVSITRGAFYDGDVTNYMGWACVATGILSLGRGINFLRDSSRPRRNILLLGAWLSSFFGILNAHASDLPVLGSVTVGYVNAAARWPLHAMLVCVLMLGLADGLIAIAALLERDKRSEHLAMLASESPSR